MKVIKAILFVSLFSKLSAQNTGTSQDNNGIIESLQQLRKSRIQNRTESPEDYLGYYKKVFELAENYSDSLLFEKKKRASWDNQIDTLLNPYKPIRGNIYDEIVKFRYNLFQEIGNQYFEKEDWIHASTYLEDSRKYRSHISKCTYHDGVQAVFEMNKNCLIAKYKAQKYHDYIRICTELLFHEKSFSYNTKHEPTRASYNSIIHMYLSSINKLYKKSYMISEVNNFLNDVNENKNYSYLFTEKIYLRYDDEENNNLEIDKILGLISGLSLEEKSKEKKRIKIKYMFNYFNNHLILEKLKKK